MSELGGDQLLCDRPLSPPGYQCGGVGVSGELRPFSQCFPVMIPEESKTSRPLQREVVVGGGARTTPMLLAVFVSYHIQDLLNNSQIF